MAVFPQMLQRPDLGSSRPRLTCPDAPTGVMAVRMVRGKWQLLPMAAAAASWGMNGLEEEEEEAREEVERRVEALELDFDFLVDARGLVVEGLS